MSAFDVRVVRLIDVEAPIELHADGPPGEGIIYELPLDCAEQLAEMLENAIAYRRHWHMLQTSQAYN